MIENATLRITNRAPAPRKAGHALAAPACAELRRAFCRRFFAQSPKLRTAGNMLALPFSLFHFPFSNFAFLIETRKRLKIAATQTKQSSPVTSNRVKIAGVS
jgi:hypothetical protein